MGRDMSRSGIAQRCRIFHENKLLEQKFLILSCLWKNRQEGRHSGGKEENHQTLHDRGTWEREVLQKGTYVLSMEELHTLKDTYQAELSINRVRELTKHILNEDQELNLDDHETRINLRVVFCLF